MSLSTSYRYEANLDRKSLLRALERQKDRIKYDELMDTRDNSVKLEKEANLRAEWNENLEEASQGKHFREDLNIVKGEMRIANKATVDVRRAALKQLLDRDRKIYEQELNSLGKTFYVQRT